MPLCTIADTEPKTRHEAPHRASSSSADPRAYSRNKRGIAGNIIWLNFDRHALLNLFYKAKGRYVADADEIRPQYRLNAPDANALFQSSIVRNTGLSVGATLDQLDTPVSDVYSMYELALPNYSDQVMPFDITLSGANEYGAMCAAKILGVEILNEDLVLSSSGPKKPSRVTRDGAASGLPGSCADSPAASFDGFALRAIEPLSPVRRVPLSGSRRGESRDGTAAEESYDRPEIVGGFFAG